MEIVFKILLVIHIIAGSVGLFTGTINIVRPKGDKPHRLVGKYFFIGMLVNAVAGFLMALMHPNVFLMIIAVFSFYMTATGQRFLSLKRIDKGQSPTKTDWILTLMMILFALGFILYGLYLLAIDSSFGIVLLVFGSISMLMAKKDISIYKGNITTRNYWLLLHIQRMTGAYIAALTAFLVVNNTYLPPLVAWLAPTVIFTPLIFFWSKKNALKIVKR